MELKFSTLVVISSLISAGGALADPVGKASSLTGDEGTSVAIRDGQPVVLEDGSDLLLGDRIIVRGNGSGEFAALDCVKTLSAPAMAVVDDGFCDAPLITLQEERRSVASAQSASTRSGTRGRGVIAGSLATGSSVAAAAALAGAADGGSASGVGGISDGGTAFGGSPQNPLTPAPITDTPLSAFQSDAVDAGSGLDTGLFGFFEATSS
ncbi:MAG: hypothetical protein AAGJ32_04090 [Pseudomonadota bacterium]